jgi:hypothetical protein
METNLKVDVAALDAPHRRALEEMIGRPLAANQQLAVSVIEGTKSQAADARPAQTLDDWTHVYDGLSDDEIEDIDKIVRSRANLSRNLP